MAIKLAINGFGRIGRVFLREALKKVDLEIVAINDLTDVLTLAHLFKYDSVHRKFNGEVSVEDNNLVIDGHTIKVVAEKDTEQFF